jgi:hypothetical protein
MAATSEDGQHVYNCVKNPILHDKSKHFEVHNHFIRECVEAGRTCLDQQCTQNQLADILMKPLCGARFSEPRGRIGVEEMVDER